MSWGAAINEWANENLTIAFAAQAQTAIANAKQTRAPGLHALDSAARANSEFRHAADPFGFAVNVVHLGPFADLEHFERQKRWHEDRPRGNRN
jgi:hypothetical protein